MEELYWAVVSGELKGESGIGPFEGAEGANAFMLRSRAGSEASCTQGAAGRHQHTFACARRLHNRSGFVMEFLAPPMFPIIHSWGVRTAGVMSDK